MTFNISTMPIIVNDKNNCVVDMFQDCVDYLLGTLDSDKLDKGVYIFRLSFTCEKEDK